MKNHEKAKELYEEIDPTKNFLDMVVNKIYGAIGNYTLKGLMEDLGDTFAHNGEPEEAISVLEAIYEAFDPQSQQTQSKSVMQYLHDAEQFRSEFSKFTDKDRDNLFDEAFNRMHKVAEEYYKEDLLKALNEYYPKQAEEEHKVPALGEGDIVTE